MKVVNYSELIDAIIDEAVISDPEDDNEYVNNAVVCQIIALVKKHAFNIEIKGE